MEWRRSPSLPVCGLLLDWFSLDPVCRIGDPGQCPLPLAVWKLWPGWRYIQFKQGTFPRNPSCPLPWFVRNKCCDQSWAVHQGASILHISRSCDGELAINSIPQWHAPLDNPETVSQWNRISYCLGWHTLAAGNSKSCALIRALHGRGCIGRTGMLQVSDARQILQLAIH